MRILHTSDWHVGKKLGRFDRLDDHRAVLHQIMEVADDESTDLVLVSGDLFDRALPPIDALHLVIDSLRRLATKTRPVIAIAGNHDNGELFELLAGLLKPMNVHLVGQIKRPDKGGVLELNAGGQRALVACLPFLREGKVVDFMQDVDAWYGQYAERVALLTHAYNQHLLAHADANTVNLMVAHFMLSGARIGGHGMQRGERSLHIGETYAATEQAIPPGPQYVALGHIHAPQSAPGAAVPAEYAGSTLELDFGEAGEKKRVVLVDAKPGLPAVVTSRELSAGRRLLRASGRLEALRKREELQHAFVDLTVETDGPDPNLAERAKEAFPLLVRVRADYPRDEPLPEISRQNRPWEDLYHDYYQRKHGVDPEESLMATFREIYEEVQ